MGMIMDDSVCKFYQWFHISLGFQRPVRPSGVSLEASSSRAWLTRALFIRRVFRILCLVDVETYPSEFTTMNTWSFHLLCKKDKKKLDTCFLWPFSPSSLTFSSAELINVFHYFFLLASIGTDHHSLEDMIRLAWRLDISCDSYSDKEALAQTVVVRKLLASEFLSQMLGRQWIEKRMIYIFRGDVAFLEQVG